MIILKFLRNVTRFVLFLCLCLCGYLLFLNTSDTREQDRLQANIACYKPEQTVTPEPASPETVNPESVSHETHPDNSLTSEDPIINQTIIDLQTKYPDVLGWLTLDNTAIDYPFVLSLDNDDYLHADLDGNYSVSGTIFMDCRCDISSFLTILYGHNMRNGTMFADIEKYADDDFWVENTGGTLYLPHETYQLQVIAYLVVSSTDAQIYAPAVHVQSEIDDFQTYIAQNARQYHAANLTVNDRILVLSTCDYEYTGARSVLILKLAG